MDPSSEPEQYLERVRGALEKVRRVLGNLDANENLPAGATRRGVPAGLERGDLLRAHEVARLLNITIKDVYAVVRDRRLRAARIGRFLWFRRDDVEEFAKHSRRGGGSPPGPGSPPGRSRVIADRHAATKRRLR